MTLDPCSCAPKGPKNAPSDFDREFEGVRGVFRGPRVVLVPSVERTRKERALDELSNGAGLAKIGPETLSHAPSEERPFSKIFVCFLLSSEQFSVGIEAPLHWFPARPSSSRRKLCIGSSFGPIRGETRDWCPFENEGMIILFRKSASRSTAALFEAFLDGIASSFGSVVSFRAVCRVAWFVHADFGSIVARQLAGWPFFFRQFLMLKNV